MAKKKTAGVTGTYRFDADLGKVVQVSARVPKVASKGHSAEAATGPCGRQGGACGRRRCGS